MIEEKLAHRAIYRAIHEALGWMYNECCCILQAGQDPRTIEVDEIVAKFRTDVKAAQKKRKATYN